MYIRRGTTPNITLNVSGVVQENIVKAIFTLKQGSLMMNKEAVISTDDNNIGIVTFTQEETLQLVADKNADVQVKFKDKNGKVMATDISQIEIKEILNVDEV